MATIIHFNGYSVRELPGQGGNYGDWEHVCWGDPANRAMGRIPTAIYYAIQTKAKLLIWSTGATQTHTGECEAQYSLRIASERAERYAIDFPERFDGLINDITEFRDWLNRISFVDCQSTNTATAMELAIPVIDITLGGRPGSIYTISSANHVSRALRDALSSWQLGIVLEEANRMAGNEVRPPIKKRSITPIRNPHLVTIGAIAAGTSYANGNPSDTLVEELATSFKP